MKYFFHPEARRELLDAIKYYNECGSALGYIFMEKVQAAIDRIIRFSKAWAKLSPREWI